MIDPNNRAVQLGALLDKLAQELALGKLGDVDECVLFFRGKESALICVDGVEDNAITERRLRDALHWMKIGALPSKDGDAARRDRMEWEARELGGNLERLSAFMSTPPFWQLPATEQFRLVRQQVAMRLYYDVLSDRIGAA